jgi:CheY-like chemotaxis protein
MNDILEDDRSRHSVLVVEDNTDFARLAKQHLKSTYNVTVAGTLKSALALLESKKFSFIISDAHFPADEHSKPTDNSIHMVAASLRHNVPLCFITLANRKGRIDNPDKDNEIAIKVLSFRDASESVEKCMKSEIPLAIGFNDLSFSASHVFNKAVKDQVVWAFALLSLQNISANTDPISAPMKHLSASFDGRFGLKAKAQNAQHKAKV